MAGVQADPFLETLTDELTKAFTVEITRQPLEAGRALVHAAETKSKAKLDYSEFDFKWSADTWKHTSESIVASALEHIDASPAATWTWRLERREGVWPWCLRIETPKVDSS